MKVIISLMMKSVTRVQGQAEMTNLGKHRRVEHYNYVYLTTCNDRQATRDIHIILIKLGIITDKTLFNIETTFDCESRLWTVRFSCTNDNLPEHIVIDTDASLFSDEDDGNVLKKH